MSTFLELQQDVASRTNESSSTDMANYRRWINAGERNITRRFLWPFLKSETTVSTVASTDTYDLTAGIFRIYSVRDTTNLRPIAYQREMQFDRAYGNGTASGVPYIYMLPGQAKALSTSQPQQKIQFYPIPSAVYSIKVRYFAEVTAMSNDSDIPTIPDEFHELLVDYACRIHFGRKNDARSKAHYDLFEDGLMQMVDQFGALPADRIDYLRNKESVGWAGMPMPMVTLPPNFPRRY